MQSRPAFADDMTVHHARLVGRGAGRGVLERALAGVYAGDVTDRDEILVIPHFRSEVPLSTAAPPAYFAHRLSAQLLQLRRDALVDPSGFAGAGKVLRFTSKATFAFWVLAGWLRGGEAALAVSNALESERVSEWQRQHVLNDARLFVTVVGSLARAGIAARWVGQLAAQDIALATAQLTHVYRVPITIWETPDAQPATPVLSYEATPRSDSRRVNGAHKFRKRARLPAPAISIAPIVAAADQAGNDLSSLEEPARRLLAVTLALSASPGIGPHLARIDWKLVWARAQPVQAKTDDVPEMRTGRISSAMAKPSIKGSRQRLPSALPDIERRVATDDRHVVADIPTETKLATNDDVHPASAEIVQSRATSKLPTANAEAAPSPRFSTSFGGLFFLVNVFTALELYPDFTRPLNKGLDVSPFWLLDRLALRMFGARYRADPLHRWLASVGRGGALPERWAVDPSWLDGIGVPLRVGRYQSRSRLTFWDARGFALLDLPSRDMTRASATRPWSRRARSGGPVPASLRRLPAQASARWVACLAAFLEFRLGLAAPGLSAALIRMPAQISFQNDSVSVRFALAALPLAIRMAGLDRNPGWLPAEGRDLMFEFV